ncbi:uncharacterized protein LOC127833489 [Dreissena polymorpha]|uniref:Mab-21-like nucleotidyltransferase domain-containing protein n=1 Tax=Dreissena polymorpha TaxID=45954 RepID=A0A9D4JE36_DREPO|nr:uncharacterized protein LOC127833489 [Dreissena polymorpha]XP_052214730.1 uncharacterized protein LOC127833489 [Dreissena polymorpha]XP_052214731.1 uncharacterized protein LOC127833489 [Dreissena polymorpha]KAH3809511.1 hypothetical protein DPMN_137884 [Dreissena polymorpha]
MTAKLLNDSKVSNSNEESFSHLVEQKVLSLRRNIISERADKIADVVYRSVNVILDKVSELEPRFTVSEILKVGSYFEGTKIDKIDEFDFLVVIKELSKPGAIHLNKIPDVFDEGYLIYTAEPGMVQIKLQDDDLKIKWRKYVVDDFLTGFHHPTDIHKRRQGFGSLILESIKIFAKTQHEWRNLFFEPGVNMFFNRGGLTLLSISDSERVILKTAEVHHPNTVLELKYDGSRISVDLSPAIRYDRVEDCFEAGDCVDERLAAAVLDRGSILLVAKQGNYFRITFTETEVKFMRDKIHGVHKLIYMYLKYIKCLYAKQASQPDVHPFSSYMLKMVCIHHDMRCTSENKTVSKCLDEVLDLMADYCEKDDLPNVFNTRLTYLDIRDTESEYRLCMLDGLRKIKELAVENPTEAYFNEVIKDVVEQSANTFDVTREMRFKKADRAERRFRAECERLRKVNESETSKDCLPGSMLSQRETDVLQTVTCEPRLAH